MITKLLVATLFLCLTYFSCQNDESDTASVGDGTETELSTEEIAQGHKQASDAADDAEQARLLLLPKLFDPNSSVYQNKESHKKIYKELIANPKAFSGFMSRLNQFRISQGKKPINPADFADSTALNLNLDEAVRATPIEECVTSQLTLPENALIPVQVETETLQLADEAPAAEGDDEVQWNGDIECAENCVCAVGYGVAYAYAYGYGYAGAQCSDGTFVYATAEAEAYAEAEAFAFAMACLPEQDDNQCEEGDGEDVPDDCVNDHDDNPFIEVLRENAKCITDGDCEDILPPPTTTTEVETDDESDTGDGSSNQTTTTLPIPGSSSTIPPGGDL